MQKHFSVTAMIKNFYISIFDVSDILESHFHQTLDIGNFDDYLLSVNKFSDVDIDGCHYLMKETIAWKDYLIDMLSVISFYKDKFVVVKDCYEFLSNSLKDNKLVPKDLLKEFKITSVTVADIVMEVNNKLTVTNEKIHKIDTLLTYLKAYIGYLNEVLRKLNLIIKGYGLRYWNSID